MNKGTAAYTGVMAGSVGLFAIAVSLLAFGLWRIQKRKNLYVV
jgi:hypothetical protein